MFNTNIQKKVEAAKDKSERLRKPLTDLEKELEAQVADGHRLNMEIDNQLAVLMNQKSMNAGLISDDEGMLSRVQDLLKSI